MSTTLQQRQLVFGGEALAAALRKVAVEAQGEMMAQAFASGGRVVQAAANQRAPRPEVEVEIDQAHGTNISVQIGVKGKYWRWRFVEYGVQPFEIDLLTGRTKRSKGAGRRVYGTDKAHGPKGALQFSAGGQVLLRKKVRPQGYAARPWLRPALDEHEDAVVEAIGAAIQRRLDAL